MKSILQISLMAGSILVAAIATSTVAQAGFCGNDKKYGKHNMRAYTDPYAMWMPSPMYYGSGYYYQMPPRYYYSYMPQAPYPIQQKPYQTKSR